MREKYPAHYIGCRTSGVFCCMSCIDHRNSCSGGGLDKIPVVPGVDHSEISENLAPYEKKEPHVARPAETQDFMLYIVLHERQIYPSIISSHKEIYRIESDIAGSEYVLLWTFSQ